MGRTSKRARKIRKAEEFDLRRLQALLRPPQQSSNAYSWTIEQIRAARDAQMRGVFKLPVRLAESMRTDDALFTAYENRLAPQRCIGVEVVPAGTNAKAKAVAAEGEGMFGQTGIGVRSETLSTINGTLANHGVAVASIHATPREDGSRIDFDLSAWPMEWVEWDPILRCLVTQVEMSEAAEIEAAAHGNIRGLHRIPIVHGDGKWLVFAKHEIEPWKQEACLLAAALVWPAHAFASLDWTKGSKSHGNAKVVGQMPEGVTLQKDGSLTPEGLQFLELIMELHSGEGGGIAPFGAKLDFLTNTSTAWQVWHELLNNREKAAARIYLGTDGILGAQGGAPGVDIAALFGVATTKIQGDLECIERALRTGYIEPWAALNFGDSKLAPRRRYLMPDADSQAVRDNFAKREKAFHEAVKAYRDNGFVVDQDVINRIAKAHGVPAPQLAPATARKVAFTLAEAQGGGAASAAKPNGANGAAASA